MKKRLLLNTISSLIFQITTIICGFILPRAILKNYGSEVNGLVSSITQFLGLISFLELGVGAVIQSSLYKPLAEKDSNQISAVLSSGNKFFKKIAFILLIYIVILVIGYPLIVADNLKWISTAFLIIAISISLFAQYYFGVIDSLLVTADQHGYIQYSLQIITLIINTVVCCALIYNGVSIQIVKLTTSIIYLLRPIILRIYVNKNYSIDRNIKYKGEPIKQKWNGLAQHIAAVVLGDTDTIVLTLLSSLENVSIYSVYFLVINGVKNLFSSLTNGIQSVLGEMWAKQEFKRISIFWSEIEFIIHTAVTFIFSCTILLIVPFIHVYTNGVTDTNYYQPLFAILLVLAYSFLCLRIPYFIMILAAGHYKETQVCHIVAAVMNICVSIITVKIWGLIGVAIGTLSAMFYQTVWMAIYNSKRLIKCNFLQFIKRISIDIASACIIYGIAQCWIYLPENYFEWIILAIKVVMLAFFVVVFINIIFEKQKLIKMASFIRKRK